MRRRAPGNKKRTKEQLRTIQPCSFELIVIGLRKELMEQEKELLEEEDGGKDGTHSGSEQARHVDGQGADGSDEEEEREEEEEEEEERNRANCGDGPAGTIG